MPGLIWDPLCLQKRYQQTMVKVFTTNGFISVNIIEYCFVSDKQKPTVDRCYSPLPVVSSESYTYVSWEEPLFSDNSDQNVFVRRSHAPGLFPMGKTTVTYTAYDQSGNNNTCEVVINVIREYYYLAILFLAHRIRISEILPWYRKSYLTHAILPRTSSNVIL